jgi:hypothetical protein
MDAGQTAVVCVAEAATALAARESTLLFCAASAANLFVTRLRLFRLPDRAAR